MTKKELEEANALLTRHNQALQTRVDHQMELIESYANYLKQIQDQLSSAVGSIENILESHATLTAPIPEKKDDNRT